MLRMTYESLGIKNCCYKWRLKLWMRREHLYVLTMKDIEMDQNDYWLAGRILKIISPRFWFPGYSIEQWLRNCYEESLQMSLKF